MFIPQKRKTAHVGHFLLTLLTGGLWVLPWILFTLCNRSYNQKIDFAVMEMDRRDPDARRNSGNRRNSQRY